VNEKRDSIRGLDLMGVEETKKPAAPPPSAATGGKGVANRWQQTMDDKKDASEKEVLTYLLLSSFLSFLSFFRYLGLPQLLLFAFFLETTIGQTEDRRGCKVCG